MPWHDKRVGVLLGGPSSEREVSLKSGRACADALRRKGYDVAEIDADEQLATVLRAEAVDVVFNALHGKWGEDGCVQGVLELLQIPYTGSGVLASAAAMDKIVSRTVFAAAGIDVPPHRLFMRGASVDDLAAAFDPPWVVKPASEGSSVGISITKDRKVLAEAFEKALRYDDRVMVEPYLRGREINVGVLDGEPLGLVEVRPKPVEGEEFTFYDYAHKYTKGMTEYVTNPETVNEAARVRVLDRARLACKSLGVEGAPRVDFILTDDGKAVILEINTLPGMTELSLLPMIARDGAGLGFDDLVERILNSARLKVGA